MRIVTNGPVLVFGGCYSNLQATEALLAQAARRGIPPERMVCTGDVVAYGADAAATVALVRRAGVPVVMGNCEEQLAARAADCGCGFAPGSACDRLSGAWFAHATTALDAAAADWMGTLPRQIDLQLGRFRLLVVHGSAAANNEFVFASTGEAVPPGYDGVIAGHCGLPFTRMIEGRLWHNSGAVGMPANDGTPRAWFSVLSPGPDGLTVEHAAFGYDHAAAAGAMRTAGLPEAYAGALETGLWPSCDVLPAAELAARGIALTPATLHFPLPPAGGGGDEGGCPSPATPPTRPKFSDPAVTARGERRATVALEGLRTLWFNTGTLCNVACIGCYIESSPRNDRLSYLTRSEAASYLAEAATLHPELTEIAFTGGEPFMNPDMPGMMEDALAASYRVLVLTNAMRPMQRFKPALLELQRRYAGRFTLRVSLDHYQRAEHEALRGKRSWQPAIDGLAWLARHGFDLAIAGRTLWHEDEVAMRTAFATLFDRIGLKVDASDPSRLVLFPEMDATADVPEITESCWGILGKRPSDVMCSSARMIVKRKGADRPAVVACTLLPYDPAFELGATLAEAGGPVALNHRHCAKFCVLGGASCSA